MALRTITAPGVQMNELDKSGYTPTPSGTAVYLKGFTSKGEPYRPMEITTRSAYEIIYGAPDTEAERYTYAAACETLNQGGRLWMARLPYDNASFEKLVGVKYTLETTTNTESLTSNTGDYHELHELDNELNNAAIITGGKTPAVFDLSAIDEYRTDEAKVPNNTFIIVDTTGATYNRVPEDSRKGEKREVIGIVPVVTTAANALYAQCMIQLNSLSSVAKYESLCGDVLQTLKFEYEEDEFLQNGGLSSVDCSELFNTSSKWFVQQCEFVQMTLSAAQLTSNPYANVEDFMTRGKVDAFINGIDVTPELHEVSTLISQYAEVSGIPGGEYASTHDIAYPTSFSEVKDENDNVIGYSGIGLSAIQLETPIVHGVGFDDSVPKTLALDAASFFSTIQPSLDGEGLDSEHLKDIGVVVFKAYLDPTEGNKVSFEPVEAYCGSLYKDDVDPTTKVTKFIDTIINSQSKYINFFSNCFASSTAKKYYLEDCDILLAPPSQGATLGFYSSMTKKDISISKSILDGMNKAFEKVEDVNKLDIDIVPDAGLANIASYIKAIFGEKGPYDLAITDDLGNSLLGMWQCKKGTDPSVKMWKTVEMKHDTFCKNVRKDCMFIADGLRPLVIQGQKKVIRDSKPTNTMDKDILPYLPAICGLNTSYGAGYVDWFEQADDYTGDFFWCPPSIKAMGVYINTDVNYNYWDAPAGLTRGPIAATDVAFSPNAKQAGAIYEKNWNYAINYPQDGIVLEGQKTFQTKPTALDRVNVRRTMLRLERQAYKALRWFTYEGNTAYLRQRVVDALEPIMKACWKSGNGGIQRYKIVCDDKLNDANTIDNNELKIQVDVVPTKTAEFIMCEFVLGSQGATWAELLG